MVFTAQQLKVSAISMVSLKMKFEGGPLVWGPTFVGVAFDFAKLLILHVTYLHMISCYFRTARANNHSCTFNKHPVTGDLQPFFFSQDCDYRWS